MQHSELMVDGETSAHTLLILAHGAGLGMDSPFMNDIAQRVSAGGTITVWRFEFPYMRERRVSGSKRPPNRMPVLLDTWREVVLAARDQGWTRVAVGGKSMGGRAGSMIADEVQASALVCLGYPFHPPGKPEKTRTEHLADLETPCLICQGERDPFGTRGDVANYPLSKQIRLHWSTDGNHDLKPRKASGLTHEHNLAEAAEAITKFLAQRQTHLNP